MPSNCPKCGAGASETQSLCGVCGSPLSESSDSAADRTLTLSANLTELLAPGGLFAGKYRVVRQIGRGGMGIVYEGEDVSLKRPVALKLLPAELLGDDRARERFIHEARASSALDHPNICTIYEIGQTEGGQIYIAMALCKGESLRQKIRSGPLSPEETLQLALQIAEGLAVAHDRGIVHRDVKPANILVSETGQARLVDFGLAKLAGEARLTRPGLVMGTLAYMSPEQLTGGEIDARTDVWSLGVVMYEMLTGQLPFEADTEPACAYSIVHKKHRPIKSLPLDLPRDLAAIVERALAKNPDDRFSSAGEMARALRALLEGREVSVGKKRSPARRAANWAVLAILITVLVLAFFTGRLRRLVDYAGLAGPSEGRQIVILPLRALSGTEDEQSLADGLSELLYRQLGLLTGQAKNSWVASLGYVEAYEVKEANDARRLLGANLVLTGSVRKTGEMLTVSLDLVDTRTLRRFETVNKADSLGNVATWQEDLALDIGQAAGIPAEPEARSMLALGGTTVPSAFLAYLRGLAFSFHEGADKAAKAREAFLEAISLDPAFSGAMINLARSEWRLFTLNGDSELVSRAETHFQEALRLNADADLGHLCLARMYRSLGRYDEAIRESGLVKRRSSWWFDNLLNLAQVYSEKQETALAESTYLRALELRPRYWVILSYLGLFYFQQGQLEKARKMFLEVTRVVPDNINGLNNLGATYFKLGQNQKAEEMFERSNAIKRNPDACSNLGHLYYYRGRYADAVVMNESALNYEKNDPLLWGNLADACFFVPGYEEKSRQAYARAVMLAERALPGDRGNAGLRSSLAVYLAKVGEKERAWTEIEEALKGRPSDPTIILKSIIVFELTGDRDKALQALRKYLELKGPMEEVLRDPFLASLRQAPVFNEIVRKGRS